MQHDEHRREGGLPVLAAEGHDGAAGAVRVVVDPLKEVALQLAEDDRAANMGARGDP